VPCSEILIAGGRRLLYRYHGSHIQALVQLYPELILKKENFLMSKEIWKARMFFDEFARSKKLNPLDNEHWYSVTHDEIIRAGGGRLLLYFGGSHIKALVKLYPELMLKKEKFLMSKKGWKSPPNRRNFFDEYARSKKFNPLDAEKWYSVTYHEIRKAGGGGLLYYYRGSYTKALVQLYPELMLKKKNFLNSKGVWKEGFWQRRRKRKRRTKSIK